MIIKQIILKVNSVDVEIGRTEKNSLICNLDLSLCYYANGEFDFVVASRKFTNILYMLTQLTKYSK
jgi:hypothetical protein